MRSTKMSSYMLLIVLITTEQADLQATLARRWARLYYQLAEGR